ncbi:hypothetical protein DC496_04890 [Bifidobacterium breve]|uniref:Uncharacterized protein n=1 Tax=Bifidobacterium breve TaxID=1685 RepID=A0AAW7LEU3_BIFBR|nr:hypothetical protein [Bifidobacterium breve]MDN4187701.1 hypothetical protein [Bifidobacterium breve]
MRAKTLDECSEASFGDFILANPCLDRHPDLMWVIRRVYWRNAKLGHATAMKAAAKCARQYSQLDPALTSITVGEELNHVQA